jgi:O-antigen/teichoic acid export membrane protein
VARVVLPRQPAHEAIRQAAMNFFRNAAGLLLTNATIVPIEVMLSIVLARVLAVDERGVYAVFAAFVGLGSLLALLGWPAASIYRLRRLGSDPARVAGAALVAVLLLSSLAVGVCLLAGPWIRARLLDGAAPRVLYLACATIPFLMLANVSGAMARGLDRFRFQNLHHAGVRVVQLAAFSSALLAFGSGLDGVLALFLAIEAVAALLLAGAVLRLSGVSLRFEAREFLDALRFGFKNYLQTLSGRLHERVDLFMLAALLGNAEQVAFYAVAANLVTRLNLAPDAFAVAAFPQMAGLPVPEAARFACRICRRTVLLVALAALALAVAAPLAIPLVYGAPYRSSIAPFLVLIPGAALLTIYRILARYFAAIDRQQANIATQGVSVGVNVALNLWWIPRFGILGAAGASLASYGLEAVLISGVFIATTGHGLADLLLPRRDDLHVYRDRLAGELRRWVRIRGGRRASSD